MVDKVVPWKALFFVLGALACHTLVLVGNLYIARLMDAVGRSSTGWSEVGLEMADALTRDLDNIMATINSQLSVTAGQIHNVWDTLDMVLATAGAAADSALLDYQAAAATTVTSLPDPAVYKELMKKRLKASASTLMTPVNVRLRVFGDAMTPALTQISNMTIQFSDRLSHIIEEFTLALDTAQKILGQVMSKASSSKGQHAAIMLETFNVFDSFETGFISLEDLHSVSVMYGIGQLSDHKMQTLFSTHDVNGDGRISRKEFRHLVGDATVPGLIPIVLRKYAQKLAQVAGSVAGAKMRDEVATCVVEYLALVSSRNMAKVAWVSERLTNDTLPLEFTATVLKQLVTSMSTPNSFSSAEVGAVIVSEMLRINPQSFNKAVNLMASPEFCDGEGFDSSEQIPCVKQVTEWIRQSNRSTPQILVGTPEAVDKLVAQRRMQHEARQNWEKEQEQAYLWSSNGSLVLRAALLGGSPASNPNSTRIVQQTVKSGTPAANSTLQFAEWLSWNASATSAELLAMFFDHELTLHNPLDPVDARMQSVIAKTKQFLSLVSNYSHPQGIKRLERLLENFTHDATVDLIHVLDAYVDKAPLPHRRNKTRKLPTSQLQKGMIPSSAVKNGDDLYDGLASRQVMPSSTNGTWLTLVSYLGEIQRTLPTVIDSLSYARREVSSFASELRTIFRMLKQKGSPIFNRVSRLHRGLWVTYYILFVLLTLCIVFYAFWSSGWFGGPVVRTTGNSQLRPVTMKEHCQACWICCSMCFRQIQDNDITFWSITLFLEVVVLALFIVALISCMTAGLQAFLRSGCSQVYVLSDSMVCSELFTSVQSFLGSFWADRPGSIEAICDTEMLLICGALGRQMGGPLVLLLAGGVLASLFTLLMIIESANLHEKTKWKRIYEHMTKKP